MGSSNTNSQDYSVPSLYNYQKTGIAFLKERKRCILADEMGLGKTAQALKAAERVGATHTLVICPKSAIGVWSNETTGGEIKKWLNTNGLVVTNKNVTKELLESYPVVVVSYSLLIGKAADTTLLNTLKQVPWDVFILDEAHKLKNRRSKTFKCVKALCASRPNSYLFLLTATPVLNRPEELWALLHLIDPERYRSFWRWVNNYCITRPAWFNPSVTEIIGVKDPKVLKASVDKYILRRLKDDVITELPSKTFVNIPVYLTEEQQQIYTQMEREQAYQLYSGREISAVNLLALGIRLKQIAVSPDLLDPHSNRIFGAKIDTLLDILESTDQKVVVFSQFAQAIRRLHKIIPNSVVFTGAQNDEQRQHAIYMFQNSPDTKVFLATTQTGGQSITLTAASTVVFLDLLWTPKLNEQAADRVHRLGQTKPVLIIVLTAVNTIEDYILKVLHHKEQLFDSIIPYEPADAIARYLNSLR